MMNRTWAGWRLDESREAVLFPIATSLMLSLILSLLVGACSSQPVPEPPVAQEPGQLTRAEDVYGTFYSYVPTTVSDQAGILALIHGTPPKAESAEWFAEYSISQWIDFAETEGLILLAPAFNQEDFSSRYGDRALSGYRGLFGREIGADEWLIRLTEAYRAAYGLAAEQFMLYGHSAGGQFTARFLVSHPELVKKAAITAAATYPQPKPEVAWPFGLGQLEAEIEWDDGTVNRVEVEPELEKWLAATQVPLTVIVGLNDITPLPASLIPGQEGRNRVAIARNWVEAMAALAETHGLPSRFEVEIIPNQGHTLLGLIPYSQEALARE